MRNIDKTVALINLNFRKSSLRAIIEWENHKGHIYKVYFTVSGNLLVKLETRRKFPSFQTKHKLLVRFTLKSRKMEMNNWIYLDVAKKHNPVYKN